MPELFILPAVFVIAVILFDCFKLLTAVLVKSMKLQRLPILCAMVLLEFA
jgi:hypothetical protein